jgi:hypothetical protein
MDRPNRAAQTISRTFFVSQLIAIGLFTLTAAAADFADRDSLSGGLLIVGVAVMVGVVWGLHLPSHFATRLSPRLLSFGAIFFSIFAVVLSYQEASGFGGLPEDVLSRPSMQTLRWGATLAFGAFVLALLANVIAASALLRTRRQSSA